MPRYRRILKNGHTFIFKFEDEPADMLHIFARHTTTPADAIRCYFTGETSWNEGRQRFETYSDTHGLYWFWRSEADRVVMVITCFSV